MLGYCDGNIDDVPHGPLTNEYSPYAAGSFAGNTLRTNKTFYTKSRIVPIANKIQPRAWGVLACVYLGHLAS